VIYQNERPRGFPSEGAVIFGNSGCYFLQQLLLQHCLPLQQLSFGVVAAVAVPIKAARLAISRRYFIRSSFEFRYRTRPRRLEHAEPSIRRPPSAAAERAVFGRALLRDHRSLKLCHLFLLPGQVDLRCRGKAAGRRPARYNTSQWLFRRG